MIRSRGRLIAIAVVVLVATSISACSRPEKEQIKFPTTAPAQPKSAAGEKIRVMGAREYIQESASLTLLSIRAAEAALNRTSNAHVRSVAQRALKAQTGLSAQLSFAGRRLNLLPSARLLPQHDKMLRELVSSSNFEKMYITQQRAIATSAYRLHSNYLRMGSSATLIPVARNALAVTRSELEQLNRI